MRFQAAPFWIAGFLFLALLPLSAPPATAEVVACSPDDFTDPSGDVVTNPTGVPDTATSFGRIDLLGVCVAESNAGVHVLVTVASNITASTTGSYNWTLTFNAGAKVLTRAYAVASSGNTATPAGTVNHTGARIQFNLSRTETPAGTTLSSFVVASGGSFVPALGSPVTGTDRAPNSGTASLTYVVGSRAPAGADSDGDGLSDADEIKRGTNPGKADTDDDGVGDANEVAAGTDPLKADTDGDGLLDGANVVAASSSERASILTRAGVVRMPDESGGAQITFLGEVTYGSDPKLADSDGDGLLDGNEVLGTGNTQYRQTGWKAELPGSTNPAAGDTDGDGLKDGEELAGTATVGGSSVSFPKTDPNVKDTDGEGLLDGEEVRGVRASAGGLEIKFKATNPTLKDTDGDGVDDFTEVRDGTDPTRAGSKPSTGGASDILTYLPLSLVALLLVLLACAGGILWRWA